MRADRFAHVVGNGRGSGRLREQTQQAESPRPRARVHALLDDLNAALVDRSLTFDVSHAAGCWLLFDDRVDELARQHDLSVHRTADRATAKYSVSVFAVYDSERIALVHVQVMAAGGGAAELYTLDSSPS